MAGKKRTARTRLTGPTISDVNQLLEKLLLKELPLKQNGIEISFQQPSRAWSARLNGPTLNLFLFDCRKHKYQQAQWESRPNGRGRAVQQRPPLRVDLQYLVTAWVNDGNPDEEHYLLTAALLALARHPRLPHPEFSPDDKNAIPEGSHIDKSFLPEKLQDQPWPIPLAVAEPETVINPVEVWNALDNDLRPSLICRLSLALDPFQPVELALVGSRQIRTGQMAAPTTGPRIDPQATDRWPRPGREIYRLHGSLQSSRPLEGVRLILVGRGVRGGGLYVPLISDPALTSHRFQIEQLPAGRYSLEMTARDWAPVAYPLVISRPAKQEERKGEISLVVEIQNSQDHHKKGASLLPGKGD